MFNTHFEEPQILSQTPRWVVVDKPSGMLSIPGVSVTKTQSVLDWLRRYLGPVWAVHRLDRETSGVLLFARSARDHQQASLWFQKRQVKKHYDCLAGGHPPAPLFQMKQPLGRHASLTQVQVIEQYVEGFLARVTPKTGRRHQIRKHLTQSGCALWGDVHYGGASRIVWCSELNPVLEIARVALHARTLILPTAECFEAPWPSDFSHWLQALRRHGQPLIHGLKK